MKTIWSVAWIADLAALSGSIYVAGRAISDRLNNQTVQISSL